MYINKLNDAVYSRVTAERERIGYMDLQEGRTADSSCAFKLAAHFLTFLKDNRLTYAEAFALMSKPEITAYLCSATNGTERTDDDIRRAVEEAGIQLESVVDNIAEFNLYTGNDDENVLSGICEAVSPVCIRANRSELNGHFVYGEFERKDVFIGVLKELSVQYPNTMFRAELITRNNERSMVRVLNGKTHEMSAYHWDVDYPDIDEVAEDDPSFWDGYYGEKF